MSGPAKRDRMMVDVEDLRQVLEPVDRAGKAREVMAAIKRKRAARDRLRAALSRRDRRSGGAS